MQRNQHQVLHFDVLPANPPLAIRIRFHGLFLGPLYTVVGRGNNQCWLDRTSTNLRIQFAMFLASLALVMGPLGVLKSIVGICFVQGLYPGH